MLEVAGYSEDGKQVIKGIFSFYETVGLPLDFVIQHIKDNDAIPSWYDFVLEARAAGMKDSRIKSKLEEVILDVYGRKYWVEISKRLELMGIK